MAAAGRGLFCVIDRLRQRRESDAGARDGETERDIHTYRAGRLAVKDCAATAYRKRNACIHRRRVRPFSRVARS